MDSSWRHRIPALGSADMHSDEGLRLVLRNPANRRGERLASIATAVGGGIAVGGGLAFVGVPVMAFAALARVVFANSRRVGLRSEGDELFIDTSITTTRAPWAKVERVVVGANAGLVYFKHKGCWRYLRLAAMGEPLAKPRQLREALVELVRDTSFAGSVEMGGATVPGPVAALRMSTVDLARWPPRIVMPRAPAWWWALAA